MFGLNTILGSKGTKEAKALQKDSKKEKGEAASLWLMQQQGSQYLTCSARVTQKEALKKAENWESEKQIPKKWSWEEMQPLGQWKADLETRSIQPRDLGGKRRLLSPGAKGGNMALTTNPLEKNSKEGFPNCTTMKLLVLLGKALERAQREALQKVKAKERKVSNWPLKTEKEKRKVKKKKKEKREMKTK